MASAEVPKTHEPPDWADNRKSIIRWERGIRRLHITVMHVLSYVLYTVVDKCGLDAMLTWSPCGGSEQDVERFVIASSAA